MNKFIDYSCFLPTPWHLPLLIHSIVVLSLVLNYSYFSKESEGLYLKLASFNKNKVTFNNKFLLCVILIFSSIVLIYLSFVDFFSTGLYGMISLNKDQNIMRENSLKLQPTIIKYLYSFVKNAFGPFLTSFLILKFFTKKRMSIALLILFIIFFSNLNGEKSFIINYSLILSIYLFLFKKNSIWLIIILIVIALFLPIIFWVRVDMADICCHIIAKLNRVLIVPLKVGTWYIHDTQINGFDFKAIIPGSLVSLFDKLYYYENYIGQKYGYFYFNRKTLESIHSDSSFIFYNYKGLGLLSIPFSIFLIYLSNYTLIVYKKLNDKYTIVLFTCTTAMLLKLISGNYYTAFFSGGIIPAILLCLIANHIEENESHNSYNYRSSHL
jgi:hypothetical protein